MTVGTHNQGFDRLIRPMDELCAELDEHVVMQIGASAYEPRHVEFFRFTSSERMQELTRQASTIVMHAAAGSIILALRTGKPLVLIPRLKQYGEHIDDHQLQLATQLEKQNQAICVVAPTKESLDVALKKASYQKYVLAGATQLVTALRQELAGLTS
ncbi:MAG: glycosyltransferase [Caldilineaceae bacterium]